MQFSPLRIKTEENTAFWQFWQLVVSPRSSCCSLRLEQAWPHSFKQASHSVKYMWLILNIKPEKQVSAIHTGRGDFVKGEMFAEDDLLLDVFCGLNKRCLAVRMLICFAV